MRRVWWFAIGGGVVLAGLLVVLGFAFLGGGDSGTDATSEPCRPPKASPAAGNANVDARALGKGYSKQIVIRVTDKESGAPVHGANVSVQGTMDCPHFMPLYEKNLREGSTGTYKGDYQLIMQGHWTFHIVVRSKESGSTTASLPLTLKIRG
jgi:YtkA-like protein